MTRPWLGRSRAALTSTLLVSAWVGGALVAGHRGRAYAQAPPRAAVRPQVILVRPLVDDPVAIEVLGRVRGELNAAGFEVLTETGRAGALPREAVETAGAAQSPVGAFALVLTRDPRGDLIAADLWVSDRLGARTWVERTLLDETHAGPRAAALAVRAAELLRVSLAPPSPAPAGPITAPAPVITAPATATTATSELRAPSGAAAETPAPGPRRWSVAVGAAWLGHALAGSSSWQAALGLGWRPTPAWQTELALALPLDEASTSGVGGRARVALTEGSLGVSRFFREGAWLRPWAGGHLGLLRARVTSEAAPAFLPSAPTAWAMTTAVGGGVALRLGARLVWRTAVEVALAWPRTDVRVEGNSGAPGAADTAGAAISWPAFRLAGCLEVSL